MPIYRQGAQWYVRLERPDGAPIWGGYPTRAAAEAVEARHRAVFAPLDDPTRARSPDSWRPAAPRGRP